MGMAQRYVKSSDFSESLLKKLDIQAPFNQYFKLVPIATEEINFDVDGSPMPPESAFKSEFIAEIKTSSEEEKKGLAKEFKNVDALFNHLDNL